MLSILDTLLLEGYFKEGKTGYKIHQHCFDLWGSEFHAQLLINGLAVLSGRRKGRKSMPMRKVPKTAETWVVYKE